MRMARRLLKAAILFVSREQRVNTVSPVTDFSDEANGIAHPSLVPFI